MRSQWTNRFLQPTHLAPFILSVFCLLPFFPYFLNPQNILLFRDLAETDLPAARLWLESVTSFGTVPYWNHLQGAGAPVLPDLVSRPLYPLNGIYLIFGIDRILDGLMFFVMSHYILLYWGFFFLARQLKLVRPVACLMGIMGALNGFSVSVVCLTHILVGITSLPWFFFFWDRFLHQGKGRHLVAASICVAWPVFGGDPQFTFYLALSSLPYALSFVSWRRACVYWSFLGIASLLLAAPQLLPSLTMYFQSTRFTKEGFFAITSSVWALHPSRLIELLVPNFFGYFVRPDTFLAEWQTNRNAGSFFINSIYLGAFPAICICWYLFSGYGFRKRKLKRTLALLSIATVGIWISMGSWAKPNLYSAIGSVLPLWSSFRYPERVMAISLFSLTVLSGYSMQTLLASLRMKRLNRRWWIAGTLVLLFFGTLFSYAYFRLLQLNGNLNTVIAETTIFGMCAGSVFLARKRPRYFLLFASMAALGGFWRSFQGNIEYQDRAQAQSDFYRSTKKIVDDLQSRVELRMKGAPDRVLSLNRASFFGVPEEAPPGRRHFHWMEVGRWETLSGNISGFLNIPSVQGHYSLEIASRMRLIEYFYSRERHSDLFNLMGARYLLTRDGAKPLEVRVNLDALENFRSFDQFTVANQENELALVAANRDFTKNLVLLNGPSEEALVPVKKTAAKLSFQNSQSSTFSVASEEAGTVLFLVNSTWAPGWKAFASGNELPIFRANGWSKAVFLKFDQPGTKAVEFKYQEGGFAPGLVLFAFWLVLSSALWRRRFVGAIQ